MAKPEINNTVKIHYTGRLTDGTEFDSSRNREPLAFIIGGRQVIPGFENAVLNLEPGESITVTIPADQAYGARKEEMIATVARAQFPETIPVELGAQLQIPTPDGSVLIATITQIAGDDVTIDANHHLAGKDLMFDIELVEII